MVWYGFIHLSFHSFKWHAKHLAQAMGYLVGNITVVCVLWYLLNSENARRSRGERDDRLQKEMSEDVFLGDDDPRWRFQA